CIRDRELAVKALNSSEETAWKTAERIRQRVYDLKIPHMFNESVATNVTISIGLTPLINDNIEQALARADGALYEACLLYTSDSADDLK
ncbi:diguanylate cyclase, partial [Salmonella enterica subsp. enterica serovar Oslo]